MTARGYRVSRLRLGGRYGARRFRDQVKQEHGVVVGGARLGGACSGR